jgi:tetratricopeptide (TPR) repeat protein
MMLGDVRGARRYIEAALRKDAANAYIYMDMAQTYMQTRDFETAEKWMSSARALSPNDLFIKESAQAAVEIKQVFDGLSEEEKKRQVGIAVNGNYIRETRLNLLIDSLKAYGSSEEDLFEITEELKNIGLSGQITVFKNSDSPEGRIAMGYVREHERFAVPGRRLTIRDCSELSECLFSEDADIRRKKRVLVILASSGSARALRILERFSKEADPRLRVWIDFALQECRSLLESKKSGAPAIVIHKLNS